MSDAIRISPRARACFLYRLSAASWFWLLFDIYPALAAASLPWSTTGAIFMCSGSSYCFRHWTSHFFAFSGSRLVCCRGVFSLALVGMLWLTVRCLSGFSFLPGNQAVGDTVPALSFSTLSGGHWVSSHSLPPASADGLSWSHTLRAGRFRRRPSRSVRNYIDKVTNSRCACSQRLRFC